MKQKKINVVVVVVILVVFSLIVCTHRSVGLPMRHNFSDQSVPAVRIHRKCHAHRSFPKRHRELFIQLSPARPGTTRDQQQQTSTLIIVEKSNRGLAHRRTGEKIHNKQPQYKRQTTVAPTAVCFFPFPRRMRENTIMLF